MIKIKYILFFIVLLQFSAILQGQMITGKDTLYGNEWIHPGQMYFKFPVASDGLYRISYEVLQQSGVPVDQISADKFQLYRLGKEIPIYTTQTGVFSTGDYIEFYGQRQRSEIDRFLFDDPDKQMLNPDYSMFNDTLSYFLSWTNTASNNRISNIVNDITNIGAPESYTNYTNLLSLPNARRKPTNFINEYNSRFDEGEGYGNGLQKLYTTNINTPSITLAKDSFYLNIRMLAIEGKHNIDCKINGILVKTIIQSGSGMLNAIISFPASLLTATNSISISENDPDTKGFVVSNVSINYTRSFSGPFGTLFNTDLADIPGKRYLEINNFYQSGPVPILYDHSNKLRMLGIQEATITKFNLPEYAEIRKLSICSGATITSVNQLESVSFKDYNVINGDYVIISNKALNDDGNGNNYVQEYANYRKATNGGSHQVVVLDIQELYDQFAYGNNRNIISIRNFAHFIKKKWSMAKSIFLIGKGREYPDIRSKSGLSSIDNKSFYIPTFGSPGSDNLYVITQGSTFPILSIGRIAAENGSDIQTYLDKIKDYELAGFNQQSIEDQSWKKEIIHLGGGDTKSLQVYLKNLLNGMANVIETNKFGAHVSGFYKTSTDPIQVSQNEQIFDRINKGVSIITFLGHSAVGTFDFSIDNPGNYNNYKKYPLMFSLGCYSGNYNTSTRGIGENFCFYKDKGALGFVATSYVGIPSILSDFTSEFYNQLGGPQYGNNVGEVLKNTYIQLNKQASESNRLLTEQMSYHGDPAYTISAAPGPDYTIDASTVKFNPQVLTVQLDSFTINFDVVNLGQNVNDSLVIAISQKLPGGEERQLKKVKIKAPSNRTNLKLTVLNFGKEAFGQNTLYIKLDPDNKITELPAPDAENNNELSQSGSSTGYPIYITDDAALPVMPGQFSIVNKANISLLASTADPFAKEKTYYFELDTTLRFNSPVKTYGSLKQKGGLLTWTPTVNWKDSSVYYWRITPDSLSTGVGAIWKHSSFFFRLGSKEGWSQGHQYQFKEDELVNIKIPENTGVMAFIDNIKDIFVQNYVRKSGIYPAYYINNGLTEISYGNDILAGVYVGVIDPLLGTAWINPLGGQYGSETPSNWRVRRAYPYTTGNPLKREKLISFLKDTIPSGHYVVFFTIQDETNNYKPEDWGIDSLTLGTNLFQLLEKQGAKLIRNTIGNAVPYSFVYRKDVKPLGETIASSINGLAYLNAGIEGAWERGFINTSTIGPSSKWDKFIWNVKEEAFNGDTVSAVIYGIDAVSKQKQVLNTVQADNSADLSNIDAKKYPNLQVSFALKDSIHRTSPDIRYSRIYYTGVPELAFDPGTSFTIHKDTLDQGDPFSMSIPLLNISSVNSDSVLIKYSLTGEDKNQLISYTKIPALAAGKTYNLQYTRSTFDLSGSYVLDIEVNPLLNQPEQYHFNNYATVKFYVQKDKRNPLIDVTFDGIHIIQGEIVSSKPEISIELKDENQYIKLNDTTTFKLFLKYPDQSTFINIPINSQYTQFFPASGTGKLNKAQLIYKPLDLKDGEHELLIQAKDASDNAAGKTDYKTRFKVIQEKSVSSFLPYPNPFSNSMQFVYTLTGDQSPDHIRIRIFTISGSLVKEITEQDLGILKIGTHRTDYTWDGRDDYGNKLANGVYLYQVIIKDNSGREWKSYNTKADNYMDQGFGKLVILR